MLGQWLDWTSYVTLNKELDAIVPGKTAQSSHKSATTVRFPRKTNKRTVGNGKTGTQVLCLLDYLVNLFLHSDTKDAMIAQNCISKEHLPIRRSERMPNSCEY